MPPQIPSLKERGIALITSLLFLLILSLSWISFSFFTSDEEGVIQNQIDSDQAAYLAEAGIQQALWFLSQDWNWQNWTDNKWGNGGTRVTDGSLIYYQWSGNLGDTAQAYTVQIRNDGTIQSKIASTGNAGSSNRTIEVELGSAFDYGLYSHKSMEFRTSNFTVSGANQTGYVYSKDSITGLNFLSADKITGNFTVTGGPANFSYFPKEIPLSELWKTRDPQTGTMIGFEAKINGTPTSTTVLYNNDTGEAKLEVGALLHNKTLATRVTSGIFFRKITGFDIATNTITTEASAGDGWAANDKIVVERIEVYEDYWDYLNQQLNNLNGASYTTLGNSSYTPGLFQGSQSFSGANFTYTPTVQFYGNTTFSGNIKIDGNAIFGRRHSYIILIPPFVDYSGETTISGNMVINGNAYFFNKVKFTGSGHLYVVGLVYMWDQNSYNLSCPDSGGGGSDIVVNELSPGIHGIIIDSGGGVFIRDGTCNIYKDTYNVILQDRGGGTLFTGDLKLNGYCYANGDVKINHGLSGGWRGVIEIKNNNTTEGAVYLRNGSLEIGKEANFIYTDLEGKGRIIVARDINISDDLLAPESSNPLFIASGGNFSLADDIRSAGIPFYGMIYTGENSSIRGSTVISGGLIVANNFSSYLSGTSIYYPVFDKSLLNNVGFSNNKDFVRPLLWREAN